MKLSLMCCLLLILVTGCSNEGTRCIDTYNQIGKEVLGDKFAEVVYTDYQENDDGVTATYHYKNFEEDIGSLNCPYLTDDNETQTAEFDEVLVGYELAHRSGFSSKPYLSSSGSGTNVVSWSKEGRPIIEKAGLTIVCDPRVGGANFTLVLLPPRVKKSFSEHHLQSRYGYRQSVKLKFHREGIGDLEGFATVSNYKEDYYSYVIDLGQRFDGKNLLEFLLDEPQGDTESISIKHIQRAEKYGNAFSDDNDFFIEVTVGGGLDGETFYFPSYDLTSKLHLRSCAGKGQ